MQRLFSRNRTRLSLELRLKQITMPLLMLILAAPATDALASSLTLIPIPSWATNNQSAGLNVTNRGGVLHQNEGRSITPDGKYVVGLCYDWTNSILKDDGIPSQAWGDHCVDQVSGYFYNVPDGSMGRPNNGSYAAAATGVAYRRNPSGVVETIVDGFGGGWKSEYMTSNGGTNWVEKVRNLNLDFTKSGGPVIPLANTMGATTNSDVYWCIIQGYQPYENSLEYAYTFYGSNTWNRANFNTNDIYFQTFAHGNGVSTPVNTGNTVRMNGIAATGRSVGWYVDGGVEWLGSPYEGYYGTGGGILNFVIEYPPPTMPGMGAGYNMTNVWPFAGLDGTLEGAAWAITPDGNTIFGHSPITNGSPRYGYKVLATADVESAYGIARLPDFPDVVRKPGTTWAVTPFGCNPDGRYAVGTCYRGAEKGERAVLWDTGDADANNWVALDLTDLAASEGVLGNFTKLERAYSVGVNADGHPVVTGYGRYADGADTRNRAFVLVVAPVPPRPQITAITGAGTGTITVNYTNTVAGKTYTLQYCTNLNNAPTWYPGGSKTATGTTDFQTESSVTSAQRYYRLSFTP